jgi:hypothetical protein
MEARRAIAIAIHRCAALIAAEPVGGGGRSGTTHRQAVFPAVNVLNPQNGS